jgi:peptidoglycan/xylan/chitin deacetylase (PgdA/CDA1 family)
VTFHRVLAPEDRQAYPFPGIAVTPRELDDYLSFFATHFDCGPLALQHHRFQNEKVSSRPLLAITFDDAQFDNYQNARPLLAKHGIKATFFAPVAAVQRGELLWHDRLGLAVCALLKENRNGALRLQNILDSINLSGKGSGSLAENIVAESKRLGAEERLRCVRALEEAAHIEEVPAFARVMTFQELKSLAVDGHEIGSHSMTHCMMPECDNQSLDYELSESRRILQNTTGQSIDSFCYPNGNVDARTASAVAAAGYRRAVTTRWGRNGSNDDPFQLCRCDMDARRARAPNGRILPAVVAFRMSGYYPGLS